MQGNGDSPLPMKVLCNTQQSAEAVGISIMTLQRWIASEKVKAPALQIRNGRAVRLWSKDDLARLRDTKEANYRRGRGRKKKLKL